VMGKKERIFSPLPRDVSLEDLVPKDNFYRRLDRVLDLSFVRDLVKDRYAATGRPSVDPQVFFRLQLVMFFEDIRSERQLMEVAADRLSIRWFLGYDLHEPLPDHSSLTRIRERYGLEIFRCFFERIVEECFEAGLVWGEELFFDATKVEANAAVDSLSPRWAVEAHLEDSSRKKRRSRKPTTNRSPRKVVRSRSCPRLVKMISESGMPPKATGSPGPGVKTATSRAATGRALPTRGRRRPTPTPLR
jgi:transposase